MPNVNEQTIYQAGGALAAMARQATARDALGVATPGEFISAAATAVDFTEIFGPGDLVKFATAYPRPIRSLTIALPPIQSGTGTPSTDNVRPFSGRTGASAYRTGANLHDDQTDTAGYYINQNGVITQNATYRYSALIPVQVGSTYRLSGFNARPVGGTDTKRVHGYDSNGEWVAQIAAQAIPGQEAFSFDITIPQGISFVRLSLRVADYDIAFTRIDEYAEDWTVEAGTVYAGTVDVVTGALKSRPYYPSYNGETLAGPWVSSMDEYAPGATPTIGAQVVDLGGVETETQLAAQDILTLAGQNNVWSDAGPVTVEL